MKVISVCNQKGGVGKTTTATNLAAALSREYEVLLVDGNPQQSSASDWHEAGGMKFVDCVGVNTPAMIKNIKRSGANYDFIIIDTSPAKNEVTAACIAASDLIIIPVKPSPYDLWACADLVSLIKQRQEINDGQPIARFLINNAKQGTNSFSEIKNEIEEYGIKRLRSCLIGREAYIRTAAIGGYVLEYTDRLAKSEFEGFYQEIKGLII